MFYRDAIRCADALIGEIDGAGSTQKKTGWMKQGWHRRLTWLRWMRELRGYLEDKETMGLALHVKIDNLQVDLDESQIQLSQAEVTIERLRREIGSGNQPAQEHAEPTRRNEVQEKHSNPSTDLRDEARRSEE